MWRPEFKFAGTCVCTYRKGTIVQVIKASVVRAFLERDILSNGWRALGVEGCVSGLFYSSALGRWLIDGFVGTEFCARCPCFLPLLVVSLAIQLERDGHGHLPWGVGEIHRGRSR